MGLLGALFAGVSGLDSQSNAIGIISNNISNVNTVGYKQGQAGFDTLVVPSGTTNFSPGGVIGNTQQLIDQQGLIEATSSPTDIAITGGGLMVVSTSPITGEGSTLYTRAGSFTQDADGNFVNANGYYLQGLPILADGDTAQADAANLVTVNVSSSATGTATPTSIVNMAANLDSQQTVLPGSSATGSMLSINGTEANNVGISGSTIIAGNDYGAAPTSGLVRGDQLTIVSGATTDTFTYGGYTVGRDVNNGDVGDGNNTQVTQTVNNGLTSFGATPDANTTTTSVISDIAVASGTDVAVGPGLFTEGTLTVGVSGSGTASITVATGETLNQIAMALQTQMQLVDPDATVTVASSGGASTLTVTDPDAPDAAGFSGAAVTGNNPTYTVGTPAALTGTMSSITGIGVSSPNVSATGAGLFTVGALDIGSVSVNVTNNETLQQIATDIQTQLSAADPGATASVIPVSTNNYTLLISDTAAGANGFSGAAVAGLTLNGPTAQTDTMTSISGISVGSTSASATGPGLFTPGTLTIGTSGGGTVNVTINDGDSLTTIAGNIQTALQAVDPGSSAYISPTSPYTITVVDTSAGSAGFTGDAVTGNAPTYAVAPPAYSPTFAATTTSAITGIDVASPTTAAPTADNPFTTGGFTANALTIATSGAPVTINLTGSESLQTIASEIQTALQTSDPGSTASVTGNPGNYAITIIETTAAAGAGAISGLAVSSGTFTIQSPIQSPLSDQMQIDVGVTDANDYAVGSYISVSGATDFGGLSVNGEFQVVSVDAATGTITVTTTGDATGAGVIGGGGSATVTNRTFDFSGNILNASSPSEDFITNNGGTAADFASDALKFNIAVGSNPALTFTYNSNPDAADGEFSNLDNLATAINDASDNTLTATVVQGRLYVSAANANESVTFSNGDVVGTPDSVPPLAGIDWTQELDLQNQAGGTTNVFNSLDGLAQQINTNASANLTAVVNNPNTDASITITEANPEQTINFSNVQLGGGILQELGFIGANPNGPGGVETTGTLKPTYNPTSSTQDMSSGAVTPQQTFDLTVYDSQGNAHTLNLNLIKTAVNTWAVELTAVPASDVQDTLTGDGQLASGTLIFNGDGTLSSSSFGSIFGPVSITWANGASQSVITLNLAKTTAANGLTQDNAGYSLQTASQNGSPVGQLTGVSIDTNGYVIASFSNGETQKEFQIPLANIPDPDGLTGVTGNAYSVTLASGNPTLQLAGTSGVGTFTPSALEESNVDLSTQLTNLIVAQQAYGANSKVLTIADQLLQDLDNIIQS